jgi:hypothetical protein
MKRFNYFFICITLCAGIFQCFGDILLPPYAKLTFINKTGKKIVMQVTYQESCYSTETGNVMYGTGKTTEEYRMNPEQQQTLTVQPSNARLADPWCSQRVTIEIIDGKKAVLEQVMEEEGMYTITLNDGMYSLVKVSA